MVLIRALCGGVILLAFPLGITAQSLTLAQAEEEALQHNLSLRAQRLEVNAAQADITSAQLFPNNPQLTIYGDILPTGGGFNPDEKSYGGSIAFPIELGGKRSARSDVAEQQKKIVSANVDEASRGVLLAVRSAFVDALQARAQLELAEKNIAMLDSVVALNHIRVRANELAESELARSEMAAEQMRIESGATRIEFERAVYALQSILGRATPAPQLDLQGDVTALPAPPAASLDEAKRYAMEHRADLLALRNNLAAQRANQTLQEANAVIDLSVSADFLRQQGATFYGSTLSLPIPINNRNQGEREKAGVRAVQAEEQIRALEHQINAGVESAYRAFTSRLAIVRQTQQEILPRAERVRNTVEYAYTKGGTTILDFLEAQRSYNDAMRAYIESLGALQKSAFELKNEMGE